jgi:hypothetical protein
MQESVCDRIDKNRSGAEQGDAGDGIGRVFVLALHGSLGGNNCGSAADRGPDPDEKRETVWNAEDTAHQDSCEQRGQKANGDQGDACRADLDGLLRRNLQAQENDRKTEDPTQRERHPLIGDDRHPDNVMYERAKNDRHDHLVVLEQTDVVGSQIGDQCNAGGDRKARQEDKSRGPALARVSGDCDARHGASPVTTKVWRSWLKQSNS